MTPQEYEEKKRARIEAIQSRAHVIATEIATKQRQINELLDELRDTKLEVDQEAYKRAKGGTL